MTRHDDIDWGAPEVAAHYDELPLWSAPFGLMLLDRVPLRRGQVVVDVGAGTGFVTVELAQRCGPESRVTAVDPWAAAMDRLAAKVAFLGLTNVDLVVAPAEHLPLADASVDLVVSNLGINNLDDPPAVLRECALLLRPGGRLVTTTNLVGHMEQVYAAYRTALSELGLDEHRPALDAQEQHRATVASVTDQLTGAGLEVVDVATDAFRMRFADGRALLGHWFVRLGFVPGWRSVVPAPDADRVLALVAARLDAVAAEQGALELTVPMACVTAVRR
ncbi:class I SAM-dependent methyltransferase [Terracoccus sp. 273MFTsu3.1]|uniref:class I SAM-dependent methyltransferase n=1 Tax=Terracoccus sp. 273MFTsu3.1 TaxID=1172188 RepID=UPI00039B6D6A|nr:methyltransferase domain-containing protein [Terracoccus sp. 273MFTsu3.1]